ncbi:MAG TPA: glycosyltransferase [Acidimicrobiales bacterium]|nr:glycosyltransferase [Acidimicrobiales bacterium]
MNDTTSTIIRTKEWHVFEDGPVNGHVTRSYAMVSTYPPTQCGIATFAAALAGGLYDYGDDVGIVRVGADGEAPAKIVIAELNDREGHETLDAMVALNRADMVIVQHEYGIYDGPDGESIVEVLEGIERPTIVVAHTVLEHPTPHQRSVLEAVVRAADAVVVMTEAGRVRLCSSFDVDARKVSVIPHGAAVSSAVRLEDSKEQPRLLTWGLLGPGKGIEWAVDALAMVDDIRPKPIYVVAGNTHPKVHEFEGDVYRDMLVHRAKDRHVDVVFDPEYRSLASLAQLISESTMVILPYDSPDQVTSGVLVDAIAAGRPVIATAFPHAVELLSSGAGIVVPRHDPEALADAIRRVLTTPGMVSAMASEARRLAPELAWPYIASRYAALGEELLDNRAQLSANR